MCLFDVSAPSLIRVRRPARQIQDRAILELKNKVRPSPDRCRAIDLSLLALPEKPRQPL